MSEGGGAVNVVTGGAGQPGNDALADAVDRRTLTCGVCEHVWKVPADRPEEPIACPRCGCHVCGCGCGEHLGEMRADARYYSRACAMRLKRAGGTTTRPAKSNVARTAPIAEIRAEQEDAKAHWSMIVREGILDWFRNHPDEPWHADELEPLGIPEEHRNIIGSQTAKLVNQRWMVECGRRKSVIPSRNGAKSNEYRLTELGRDCVLVGLGAGVPSPRGTEGSVVSPDHASTESGENPPGGVAGVPDSQGPGGPVHAPSAPVSDPSGASDHGGDRASDASPESVADELSETEGRLFDESVPVSASSAYSPDNPWA